MSEPKLNLPMLDGYIMGECISDHHGVRCYPAIRENTDEQYIVKIISIPASQVQLDALLLTGACKDTLSAQSYFMELAAATAEEADILSRLSKLEGFTPYQTSQIVTMDEGVGYEVCLLSPYKRSLEQQMRLEPLTHLAAVNLGLDLCAALAVSRRAGYLYADLKPCNIFASEDKGYRIGDLGFIPLNSLKYASLPDKYRSSYTAPEIRDAMATLNDTLDIYALGLVLYQVYNNGELPFDGESPEVKLPPPVYADYEMAEIILKACSPNVWERWQDPAQMGQALVNYMQRNGVNDTPIVPPPVQIPPEEPEETEEEFLTEDENEEALAQMLEQLSEEEPADVPENELSFMEELTSDETAPTEESVQELEDTAVTEEVSEMLAQADELIAHELPEPAVAPDPIDIPIPPPILPDEPEDVPDEDEEEPLDEEVEDNEEAFDEDPEESEEAFDTDDLDDSDEAFDDEEEEEEGFSEDYYDPDEKPHLKGRWIALAVAAILLVCIGIGANWYYRNMYLQTVKTLQIIGTEKDITVFVGSDIDEGLLSVTCTDTYGNSRRSNVASGKAYFDKLEPGTQYNLEVEISGVHKLLGTTTGTHTTAAQTQIMNFTAVQGTEDGSVDLTFSVVGPDSEQWSVAYAPVGSPERVHDFTGHNATITGLQPGTEYNFRLTPKDDLYVAGTTEVRFIPTMVIRAQNLTVTECGGGSATIRWELPEGVSAQTWILRCSNDAGYDETVTTTDTFFTFEGLDHSYEYNVTVTAQGMSQSVPVKIYSNPIHITGFTHEQTNPYQMTLAWTFTGNAPTAGWELSYTVNGGETKTLECPTNSAVLDVYPGDQLAFSLKCMDPVNFFPMDYTAEVPAYETFEGFGLTAADIEFSMCKTPDKEDWIYKDLEEDDYKTSFPIGEAASFLVKRPPNSQKSEDLVTITYVIRDESGAVISLEEISRTWNDMFPTKRCELDLPWMPEAAGNYTIDICFDYQLVHTQAFTIV